jgi:hypothetical protein
MMKTTRFFGSGLIVFAGAGVSAAAGLPSRKRLVELLTERPGDEHVDLHLALRYADHAIALGGGRALAGTTAEVMSAPALSALFGHRLVAVGEGATRSFLPA